MGIEKGLQEFSPNLDQLTDLTDGTAEERIAVYESFRPGQFYEHTFADEGSMNHYLDRLRAHDFDIGRGDAAFGYKMPLPPPKQTRRTLVIFRRR